MEESIRGGSVFSFEGRKKVLKLAWSTFEEVKAVLEKLDVLDVRFQCRKAPLAGASPMHHEG